jgi:hypothetical protein
MKDEKENESENCLPAIASGNQETKANHSPALNGFGKMIWRLHDWITCVGSKVGRS